MSLVTIYSQAFSGAGSNSDSGVSYRQIVTVSNGGQKVKISLQSNSGGNWFADHVSIGIWTGSSWDTTATPVELTFGGASGFNLTATGQIITSDLIDIGTPFTVANKLVVIIDWNAGEGAAWPQKADGLVHIGYYTTGTTATWNLATPGAPTIDGGNVVDGGLTSIQADIFLQVVAPQPNRFFRPGQGPTKGLTPTQAYFVPTTPPSGNVNVNIVGVSDTSSAGNFIINVQPGFGGASGGTGTGTFTPGISDAIGSVTANTAIGTLGPTINITLSGVQSNTTVETFQFITVIPGNGLNSQGGNFIPGISDAIGSVSDGSSAGNFKVNISVTPTGVSDTSVVSSFTPNIQPTLTGVSDTGTAGNFVFLQVIPGNGLNSQVGNFIPGISDALGSVSDASSIGTFLAAISKQLSSVSDTSTASNFNINVQPTLSGVSDTSSVASTGFADNDLLVGIGNSSAAGNFGIFTSFFQGSAAASLVGSLTAAISIALNGVSDSTAANKFAANIIAGIASVVDNTSVGTMSPADTDLLQSVINNSGAGSFIDIVSVPLSAASGSGAGSIQGKVGPVFAGVSSPSSVNPILPFAQFFGGVRSNTAIGNFIIVINNGGYNLSTTKFLRVRLRNDGSESPYIPIKIYDGNQALLNPGTYTEIYMPLMDVPVAMLAPLAQNIPVRARLIANGINNT